MHFFWLVVILFPCLITADKWWLDQDHCFSIEEKNICLKEESACKCMWCNVGEWKCGPRQSSLFTKPPTNCEWNYVACEKAHQKLLKNIKFTLLVVSGLVSALGSSIFYLAARDRPHLVRPLRKGFIICSVISVFSFSWLIISIL